jgi:hypothetical protein
MNYGKEMEVSFEKSNIHAKKASIDRSPRTAFAACVKASAGTAF